MADRDLHNLRIKRILGEDISPDDPGLLKEKEREEKRRTPSNIGLPPEKPSADKGYRRILLVGYNGSLMSVLEKVYSGTDVKKLEFVVADSTDEAKYHLTDPATKFDYIFTAGLIGNPEKKNKYRCLTPNRGWEDVEISEILIDGYDISFVASYKGITSFIYGGGVDEGRARLSGAIHAKSPVSLECEIRHFEEYHADSFKVFEEEREAFLEKIRAERKNKEQVPQRKEKIKDKIACSYV